MSQKVIAAVDIRVSNMLDKSGQPRLFTAGQEITGAKKSTLDSLVRTGQAKLEPGVPAAAKK